MINGWCGIPSSFSAEVMAHADWDSLVVDMQHGMIDYQMMVTVLQGISTTDTQRGLRPRPSMTAAVESSPKAGARHARCGQPRYMRLPRLHGDLLSAMSLTSAPRSLSWIKAPTMPEPTVRP